MYLIYIYSIAQACSLDMFMGFSSTLRVLYGNYAQSVDVYYVYYQHLVLILLRKIKIKSLYLRQT